MSVPLPGLAKVLKRLEDFVGSTSSRAAIEMTYIKIRQAMVRTKYAGYRRVAASSKGMPEPFPVALVSAFRAAFEARVQLTQGKVSKGALNQMFERTKKSVEDDKKLSKLERK
jgi:hypothetical protein